MRVVTKTIKAAFENGVSKTVQNTRTDGKSVFLFGNEIIKRENGKVMFSLCGWDSPTTRERINGIVGARLYTTNGVTTISGKAVDIHKWHEVK